MLIFVHRDIMRRALGTRFSPRALAAMIRANMLVDNIQNQFGHDHLHFDNNRFEEGLQHIASLRAAIAPALKSGNAPAAWRAFGQLTHTAQDYYAHSNYVRLWIGNHPGAQPGDIPPFDVATQSDPDLHSDQSYYPLGLLAFLPVIQNWVIPRLPEDSHARMNLDSPARGPAFPFAFEAAVKRTVYEFDTAVAGLPGDLLARFCDRPAN